MLSGSGFIIIQIFDCHLPLHLRYSFGAQSRASFSGVIQLSFALRASFASRHLVVICFASFSCHLPFGRHLLRVIR
jgi:hypothetical protein